MSGVANREQYSPIYSLNQTLIDLLFFYCLNSLVFESKKLAPLFVTVFCLLAGAVASMFWVDAELGSDVYLDGNIFFLFSYKVSLSLCTGDRNIFHRLLWSVSIVIPRLAINFHIAALLIFRRQPSVSDSSVGKCSHFKSIID